MTIASCDTEEDEVKQHNRLEEKFAFDGPVSTGEGPPDTEGKDLCDELKQVDPRNDKVGPNEC